MTERKGVSEWKSAKEVEKDDDVPDLVSSDEKNGEEPIELFIPIQYWKIDDPRSAVPWTWINGIQYPLEPQMVDLQFNSLDDVGREPIPD